MGGGGNKLVVLFIYRTQSTFREKEGCTAHTSKWQVYLKAESLTVFWVRRSHMYMRCLSLQMQQGWVNPSFDDFGVHDVTSSPSPPKRKQTKLSAFPSTSQKRLLQDPNRHRARSKQISSQKKLIEHDSVPWTEKHAPTSLVSLKYE